MADSKKPTGDGIPRRDYRDTPVGETVERRFPATAPSEFRVHFASAAHAAMKTHAGTSDEVELCGVLVGDVCRDDQSVFLDIAGVIEGQGANNYGAQVTFTQQTWEYIHNVREKEFPDKRIVGWYHTHPGFGIFLSNMDTFIQENFFNEPYQIAVVLETKSGEEGCFAWVDGEIVPLARYWVGDREVRLSIGESAAFDESSMGAEMGRANRDVTGRRDGPLQTVTEKRPGGGESGFGLAGILATVLLGCAVGTYMGYSFSRRAMVQAFQSECYGLLEFVSLNSAAARDFASLQEQLAEVRNALTASTPEDTVRKLAEIEVLAETYRRDYHIRDREGFRQRVLELAKSRQGLSEQLGATRDDVAALEAGVCEIYLLRLQDELSRAGTSDPENMSDVERRTVRILLQRVLRLAPQMKTQLARANPDLMEYFYPGSTTRKASQRKDDGR